MHTCKCTDPILSSVVLNESHSFIVTNMVPDMEMTKRMLQVMSEKEEKAYHADYLDYRDSLIIIANGNCCLASEEKKERARALLQEAYNIDSLTTFRQYRNLYYQIHFGIKPTQKALTKITGRYFKGLIWVMKYYYGNNASWSWAFFIIVLRLLVISRSI